MRTTLDESSTVTVGSVTITTKADPLEFELDPIKIARGPAEAIARSIANGIRRVTDSATLGTIRRRQREGISSDRKWNATGKLASSITVERDGDGFAIVAPSDRLQDDDVAQRIVDDVPAISDPITPAVDAAIELAADQMIVKRF
jgi:hypothetical protein